ncbi:MAG: hypothetical protein ABIV21_02550 [Pyrinomonadaceae bacterium]
MADKAKTTIKQQPGTPVKAAAPRQSASKNTPKTVKKPSNDVKKEAKPVESDEYYGLLSIAKISKRINLDRVTTKKRIDQHGFELVEERYNLKLYDFDAAMEAVLLETDTKFNDARARKEVAAAEQIEIKVAMMKEELVDRSEFIDFLNLLFGGVYKEVVVRMPKRLAKRLAKCTSEADVSTLLTSDLDKIFQDVRENHGKYLATATATATARRVA